VSSRFYDAVVLGRSLGSLTVATLLARRDFRVLLVGQGQRPTTYRFDRRVLARRAFTLLFGSSPVWRRLLHELAQSPQFRRRAVPQDPMFTVLAGRQRLELPPDVELFAREIEREFPEVRQVVDELYTTIAGVNAAADTAFARAPASASRTLAAHGTPSWTHTASTGMRTASPGRTSTGDR
jgi:phytoene dehydrogenase-like protein